LTKDVFEAIKGRRSIRSFKPDEVTEATVTRLLEAACHAPSAGNLQPWQFFVVKDEEKKQELARAAYNQFFLAQAPVVIVVCAQPELSARRYGERGKSLYCIQDTAAAVQNILLAAYGLGLGTCWIGAFDEDQVSFALGLPQDKKPVALIPVGYPAAEGRKPSKRPVEDVVSFIS